MALQFLKEIGAEGAAGSLYEATAYSTLQGNACISLSFVLRSANLGNFPTPPPAFDKAAELAVFPIIMSTFGLSSPPATATNTPPASTSTPTPTPTGSETTGWNTYENVKYAFAFKYPPGSSIESQSDNSGKVYLPITAGTNLVRKWVKVSVVEGANPCKILTPR